MFERVPSGESLPTGTVRSLQGAVPAFLMHRAINPFMRRILASRFHAKMGSDTLMVLSFPGRKSGRLYTFPVGYMQVEDTLISYSPFGWWRNLQGGVPVDVVLRGRRMTGIADVCSDTAEIAAGLAVYLRHNPGDAKYFSVAVDDDLQPDPADIARAAPNNVQIRIDLD